MKRLIASLTAAALSAGVSVPAGAATQFTGPAPISAHAATDPQQFTPRLGVGWDDDTPALTTDGSGVWVAVWSSDDAVAGVSSGAHSAVFVRSVDDGTTWTAPQVVRSEFANDIGEETVLATDRNGHWILVWMPDVVTLKTTQSFDNGVTWQAPETLVTGTALQTSPAIATDRAGTWIIAWDSDSSLGGTIGNDGDILYSRSTDDGVNWSAPTYLNTNAPDPLNWNAELEPRLATDGAGTWIAAWEVNGARTEVARSTDNGATWQPPAEVSSAGRGGGTAPDIATDGEDRWGVVWTNRFGQAAGHIYYGVSSDDGATWSAEQVLHTDLAKSDKTDDGAVRIVARSPNDWQVVWMSTHPLGSIGDDFDILTSYSRDGGATWSSPGALVPRAANDKDAFDRDPAIAASPTGKTIVLWGSDDSLEGTIGADWDILMAQARRDCAAAPREDCLLATRPRASSLTLKDGFGGADKLAWNWRYGESTTNADLGQPTTTSDYVLCLYDEVGGAPGLLAQWEAPAASTCSGVPCWSETDGVITYKDAQRVQGPTKALSVSAGAEGSAKIRLRASGPTLIPPRLPLPITPSVRVQLVNQENNVCWDATFSTASRNDTTVLKARSD